jgi:hypothetical protein
MRKYPPRKIREQLGLIRLGQLLKHSIHTLAPRIPNSTQPIPRHRARNRSRKVRHYKAHSSTAQPTHHTPELACGCWALTLCQAFFLHHLLEDVAELRVGAFLLLLRRVAAKCALEEVAPAGKAWCATITACWDFFIRVVVAVAECSRPWGETTMKCARSIVVPPPCRVGERVVRVVDLLELLGAGAAFGTVGGDAVWMVFEGGFLVCFSDLDLSCCGGELEDFVVVYWWCWELLGMVLIQVERVWLARHLEGSWVGG